VSALPPGSTIGIVGGGQLGRMLASAAGKLGYRVIVLEPASDAPAAQFANRQIEAPYDDAAALDELAAASDVVTYEFENVPLDAAEHLTKQVPLYPPSKALEVSQDRLTEKQLMDDLGIPVADYRAVENADDLAMGLADFDHQAVLKTRRFGYDGKGQHVFSGEVGDLPAILASTGQGPWVLERKIAFDREVSIIAARNVVGDFRAFDAAENLHEGGILRRSTVPANLDETRLEELRDMARHIAAHLGYVGVLAVETFITADGWLVNEIAPRVHNSGHWTVEACATSQFEQHIRAITGLPLGFAERHHDCVMENLLGDEASDMDALAKRGGLLTLYGKGEAREGRKMGHVTHLTQLISKA
jgi:5-(carboxyamino)imidazole ribonucleotide synthase